jgi:endonuclease YncB( thermonuclease family)
LRYISVDGEDYGSSAIANGFAYEYTYDEPYAKQEEYRKLQENAQKREYGLWSQDACKK